MSSFQENHLKQTAFPFRSNTFGYRSYCLYNYVSLELAEPFNLDWDYSRLTDVLTWQAWMCALRGPISVWSAVPLLCVWGCALA